MRAASVARGAVATLALVALALAAAAPAGAGERRVPPRFFGVMWDRQIPEAPDRVQSEQWAAMRRSGVESARVVFGWHLAQAKKSHKPNFVRTDRLVEDAARHRIDLLPVVVYAPRWARYEEQLGSAPRYPRKYAAYVSALVRRYGARGYFWRRNPDIPRRPVRAWQIWNEPHLPYQFSPHRGWQKRYGKLLRLSYREVKRRDPKAKVVLAGFVNDAWNSVASLHRRAKVRGFYDVTALHMYSSDPADYAEILSRFRRSLNRYGAKRKPIYITEVGASASRGRYDSTGADHLQVTDEELAELVPRAYRTLTRVRRRHRLQRVYWYTWASAYDGRDGVFAYSGLNAYAGMDVEPRPALAAWRRTAASYQGR